MTGFKLEDLEQLVATRAEGADPASYTATLLSCGVEKCAQKMGEEAVETVIAAISGNREELRKETADLLYHLLVVLKANDVSLGSVYQELESRTAQSGLEEKAARETS